MQYKVPVLLRMPKLAIIGSIVIFVTTPFLFLTIIMLFSDLSLALSIFLFLFMFLIMFLGINIFILINVAEKLNLMSITKKFLYVKCKLFPFKEIVFKYKNKNFWVSPYIRKGMATPPTHIQIWTKITNTISYIEDPHKKILRIIRKPRRYIQEDLQEYGKNISDLLFLGFTRRGKDKYLLAMLEWDTKPYVIGNVLDIMCEIVEKYEKE